MAVDTMRSQPNHGRWTSADATPITAEGATLPVIRAAGFEARVNAYVVGQTRRALPQPNSAGQAADRDRSPGCPGAATDLWYLSLVGARGQSTTLRALWANLVSNRAHFVWLEGVGSVALGQHRLDLAQLGYPIHWTYRQGVVGPGREVQGILEADALTCYDPLLVPQTGRRRDRTRGGGHSSADKTGLAGKEGHARAEGGAFTLSTQSAAGVVGAAGPGGSGGNGGADEAAARDARPLFLLLVRGDQVPADVERRERDDGSQDKILTALHLRFLSTRIAWLPYYPRWGAYLWERARDRGEAEHLRTWCYAPAPPDPEPTASHNASAGNDGAGVMSAPGSGSLLADAYLCRPDPLALTADLQRAIRSGVFRAPLTHHAHTATSGTGTSDRPEVAA